MSADILDVTRITHTDIEQIVSGKVLLLRIREFVPADAALEMASRLVVHHSLAAYRNTPELIRVGQSHYETHDSDGSVNEAALETYLSHADELMREIRQACSPHDPPFDRLMGILAEEIGVERARIGKRPMFAGIVRVFPEGSELLPHNDVFARDAPNVPYALDLDGQLAANIYLEVPEQGGRLQLWGIRPTAADLASLHAVGSEYGVDRSLLPPPALEVDVRPGELVMFEARQLHAVTQQVSGRRVGISCFLGYRRGAPLICWS